MIAINSPRTVPQRGFSNSRTVSAADILNPGRRAGPTNKRCSGSTWPQLNEAPWFFLGQRQGLFLLDQATLIVHEAVKVATSASQGTDGKLSADISRNVAPHRIACAPESRRA